MYVRVRPRADNEIKTNDGCGGHNIIYNINAAEADAATAHMVYVGDTGRHVILFTNAYTRIIL